MRVFKNAVCLIGLQFLLVLPRAFAADLAGTASIVAGAVSAVSADGNARLLSKGDAVFSGDRIITGRGGYVRVGLLDGGAMVLRPNTEFAIESFRFKPGIVESAVQLVPTKPVAAATASAPAAPALQIAEQGEPVGSQAFFRLVRGGFRAISGLVGKLNREEYAVRTPVATIGIRGTVYWSVLCDAVCVADSTVQGGLPAGESALGGLVSTVEQGSIQLVSLAGKTVVVMPGQFVLTTLSGTHVLLQGAPAFIGGENWLNVAQQQAVAPPSTSAPVAPVTGSPPPSPLIGSTLSTLPAVGSVAAALAIGVTVLSSDDGAAPTSTSR